MAFPRVIVIGAGLGGLCLAQGLRKAGIDVAVYERDADPAVRRQGYRIHLNGDGQAALARNLPTDLYQRVLATAGRAARHTSVFDSDLNVVAGWTGAPDEEPLAVDRLTLRQGLLSGVEDVVRFDCRFTGYESTDDGRVTAGFADGSMATGDVLVAADGVNSAVREQYLPHARIVDAGVRQITGKLPITEATRTLLSDDMLGVFTPIIGPDRQFVGLGPVLHPESDALADYVMLSFGCRAEFLPVRDDELRAMTGTALRDLVLDIITAWHPRVREMIASWDPATVFPLTLRTSVPLAAWPTSRVTLLGDAIHAMTPAGGVGANTALRDAAGLAEALADIAAGKPVEPTIAAYEAAMRDYGFAAVRQSAANGVRVIGQDPLPEADSD